VFILQPAGVLVNSGWRFYWPISGMCRQRQERLINPLSRIQQTPTAGVVHSELIEGFSIDELRA
jgi:hypothetical protein